MYDVYWYVSGILGNINITKNELYDSHSQLSEPPSFLCYQYYRKWNEVEISFIWCGDISRVQQCTSLQRSHNITVSFWEVSIGSGSALVAAGNTLFPDPVLTISLYVNWCRHIQYVFALQIFSLGKHHVVLSAVARLPLRQFIQYSYFHPVWN